MDNPDVEALKRELATLRAKVESLETNAANLQGAGGITVAGGIIAADPNAFRPRLGASQGGASGGPVELYCVFNGGKTRVRFNDANVLS